MWEGMLINPYWALSNGGAPECVWAFVVALAGALAQSSSLAEMASIQPIAGKSRVGHKGSPKLI